MVINKSTFASANVLFPVLQQNIVKFFRFLTFVSNMFTNLDITDMETCYKLFRRDVIKKIAPRLQENRFGFEPEVTAYVAESGCRVWECAIHYHPRSYDEGKKIGWKDGVAAFFHIVRFNMFTSAEDSFVKSWDEVL